MALREKCKDYMTRAELVSGYVKAERTVEEK